MNTAKIVATRTAWAIAWLLLATQLIPRAHAATAEERVDRRTQSALAMDAHPLRGGDLYFQYCSRCHGADAWGDTGKDILHWRGRGLRT